MMHSLRWRCVPTGIAVICLVLSAVPVGGVEVFKWVDENGITQYGEVLPESPFTSVERLEAVPPAPAPGSGLSDYRAVLEMARILQADRLERERLRLEKEKLRLEERQARTRDGRDYDAVASPVYYHPYGPYRHRLPPRRPYHGRPPDHQLSRPPRGYPLQKRYRPLE